MIEISSKWKKPAKLRKHIKVVMKDIRKQYKSSLKNNEESILSEWLCDNYYIFQREGISVIKDLKKADILPICRSQMPRIFVLCEALCPNGNILSQEQIEENLIKEKPTVTELELLPVMLKAVLLSIVAKSCVEKLDEPQKLLSSAVNSLRSINDIDFESLTEKVSEVEQILRQDPSGIYPTMDNATRSHYRHQVAMVSK
ncbi:MAG: hypothetical protein RSD42_05065, partial [Oscillospiraceae bacterium]